MLYRRADWLRLHAREERRMGQDVARFFADQADRLAGALQDFGDPPPPAAVSLIFRAAEEHERFMGVALPHVARGMCLGALEVLRQTEAKTVDLEDALPADLAMDLPPEVLAKIEGFLEELAEQPYWEAIQAESAGTLADIIAAGLVNGDSTYKIGMAIRETMGGKPANKRAQMIARTEVSASLNMGHVAEAEVMEAEGLLVAKVWHTAGDSDVRPSHVVMGGVTVLGSAGVFHVGGYACPCPAHWSLPAKERVRCRCSIITEVV